LRHIVEHLDQSIRNQDLAQTVGLGVTHFSRCFKGSFGVSPQGYVIRSRLERAKTLMRQSRSSLCQIALDSGFADQAHMSRLFRAMVGSPPNRWRRAQKSSASV
jgi:AraC family transcriptional regulator